SLKVMTPVKRVIVSSLIVTFVYLFSWFLTISIYTFSTNISQYFDVPLSTVLMFGWVPVSIAFSQTHYVYFFVKAWNRHAF
ncbi:hypothetical protein PENTCL1PPCAC_14512, partial [Pristionchus entomophagus]